MNARHHSEAHSTVTGVDVSPFLTSPPRSLCSASRLGEVAIVLSLVCDSSFPIVPLRMSWMFNWFWDALSSLGAPSPSILPSSRTIPHGNFP